MKIGATYDQLRRLEEARLRQLRVWSAILKREKPTPSGPEEDAQHSRYGQPSRVRIKEDQQVFDARQGREP
jgi:hypothetical protein